MSLIPTEDTEAEILATWLQFNNYHFTHIWNESWQRGTKNIIAMMNKKKRLGVSPGFPDYCIVLKRGSLLFIELKRQRKILKNWERGASPSITSKEQKQWVEILWSIQNIAAEICYWAEDTQNIINYYEQL